MRYIIFYNSMVLNLYIVDILYFKHKKPRRSAVFTYKNWKIMGSIIYTFMLYVTYAKH